jgi:hypothetical protein
MTYLNEDDFRTLLKFISQSCSFRLADCVLERRRELPLSSQASTWYDQYGPRFVKILTNAHVLLVTCYNADSFHNGYKLAEDTKDLAG